MGSSKLICIVFFAVVVLSPVSRASAALPELIPTTEHFFSTTESVLIETAKGTKISCKSGNGLGETTGSKTGTGETTFENCLSAGVKCQTEGFPAGVIKRSFKWDLGYTDKATHQVGIALLFTISKVVCFIIKIEFKGDLIAAVSPINTLTTIWHWIRKQAKGKQEFTELENGSGEKVRDVFEASINGGAFELAGEQAEEKLATTFNAEIRA